MTLPQRPAFTPDAGWISYLAPVTEGSRELALWAMEIASGTAKILAHPPTARVLSDHETLVRERERQAWDGITHYAWVVGDEAARFLVPDADGYAVGSLSTPPEHIIGSDGGLDATLFPDGRRLALVRDNNLWVVPIDPSGPPIALTETGQPGVTNGLAEYIAAEEFGRARGFWISPDGTQIAFIEADVRHIPAYPIFHGEGEVPYVESFPYPLTGAQNARCRLGVVGADGGPVRWISLDSDTEYMAQVQWTPDGTLAVLALNRSQRCLRWYLCHPDPGTVTVFYEETADTYLNIPEHTVFLRDGRALTTSEVSGHRHLVLLDATAPPRPITRGDFEITDFSDVNEADHTLIAVATLPDPRQRQAFRVDWEQNTLTALTTRPGVHHITASSNHAWFIDRYESRQQAPQLTVYGSDGGFVLNLSATPPTAEDLGLVAPEWIDFAAEDGSKLYGALYRPRSGQAPYPLVLSVYGGPHAQRVVDSWALTVDLESQYLAERGYLVLKVDNRGSAHRGKRFEEALYQRFGTVEVADQVRAAAWAVRFADAAPDRIGITGWSYGGYLTLMALATAPHVFRAGVAGAPVTDFRLYDTAYTERYMGLPSENTAGYHQASVFSHLQNLSADSDLLVIHGGIDENVHVHHTLRFISAALAQGVCPEIMLVPESRHLPRGFAIRRAIAERRIGFLMARLGTPEPGS